MRTCGYAAEMLRNEFARQKPEKKRLQLQWHMLYPENHGSKEEKLSRLNKPISLFTQYCNEYLASLAAHG